MSLARQSHTHDLAQTLAGIDFPADKKKLVDYARSHQASNELIQTLEKMPDEQYTSMADVFKGVGMTDQSGSKS